MRDDERYAVVLAGSSIEDVVSPERLPSGGEGGRLLERRLEPAARGDAQVVVLEPLAVIELDLVLVWADRANRLSHEASSLFLGEWRQLMALGGTEVEWLLDQ